MNKILHPPFFNKIITTALDTDYENASVGSIIKYIYQKLWNMP